MDNNPGLKFFGSLVDLDLHIQDLKLILKKTEEITFSEHEEGESLIADVHPDITRKSFVVTLLIALDSQFSEYCDHLKKSTNQKLKWNNLKGSALERFITYSEKVCGLNSVCNESTKQKLKGLIEIRNCIVHNNSCLDGFNKSAMVEQFADQVPGITLENGIISLTVEACTLCADILVDFMAQAYHSALEKFPK